ncbi:hypothetical protein NC651_014003 [Populus alba x Populus x berolinensis]|nr:hypothetical protein NC651_014003 [Populus alba x Populus x berolinensis]
MGAAGSLGGEGELENQKQVGGARLFLFPREWRPAPPFSKGEVSAVAEEENHQGRLWMEICEQPREGLWGGRLKIENGRGPWLQCWKMGRRWSCWLLWFWWVFSESTVCVDKRERGQCMGLRLKEEKKWKNHPLSFGCRGEEENPKGTGDCGLPITTGTRKNGFNPLPFAQLEMRRNKSLYREEGAYVVGWKQGKEDHGWGLSF